MPLKARRNVALEHERSLPDIEDTSADNARAHEEIRRGAAFVVLASVAYTHRSREKNQRSNFE
jgi:hypothetical protein